MATAADKNVPLEVLLSDFDLWRQEFEAAGAPTRSLREQAWVIYARAVSKYAALQEPIWRYRLEKQRAIARCGTGSKTKDLEVAVAQLPDELHVQYHAAYAYEGPVQAMINFLRDFLEIPEVVCEEMLQEGRDHGPPAGSYMFIRSGKIVGNVEITHTPVPGTDPRVVAEVGANAAIVERPQPQA